MKGIVAGFFLKTVPIINSPGECRLHLKLPTFDEHNIGLAIDFKNRFVVPI